MPSDRSTDRFHFLDTARGLAAIAILFWHYQHFYYAEAASGPSFSSLSAQPLYDLFEIFYRFGYCAVQFFWVLSGFVLANAYWETSPSPRQFFIHRFSRIYPLHLVTLVAVALLQIVSVELVGHWQIYGNNDWYHFFLQLGLMSDWGFQAGYSYNAPIWSVSIEVVIYFVFFLSLPLIRKWKLLVPATALTLFIALIFLHVPGNFWWCGFYFFIGSFLFGLWKSLSTKWLKPLAFALLLIGTISLDQVEWASPMAEFDINLFYVGLGFLFAGVILGLVLIEKMIFKSRNVTANWLGDASFGIYLWHIPVQIVTLIILQWSEQSADIADSPWFLAGFIAIVIAIAHLSFQYYEKPLRKKLRTWA